VDKRKENCRRILYLNLVTAQTVSERECRASVEDPYLCGTNTMKPNDGLYVYDANPEGEGAYMQTSVYQVRNCASQRMEISKDCELCPICSPYGILTNDSTAK